MKGDKMEKTKVAVLVSGGGTNLQAIIDKVADGKLPQVELVKVISSKEGAFALERAAKAGVPTAVAKEQEQVLEELKSLLHRHIKNVKNVLSLVLYLKRFSVVPLALARITCDINVGQEMHLNLYHSAALAGFASAALEVEGESVLLIASDFSIGSRRKKRSYIGKEPGVCCRIRAWRSAYRRLVYGDNLVKLVNSFNSRMSARNRVCTVKVTCENLI